MDEDQGPAPAPAGYERFQMVIPGGVTVPPDWSHFRMYDAIEELKFIAVVERLADREDKLHTHKLHYSHKYALTLYVKHANKLGQNTWINDSTLADAMGISLSQAKRIKQDLLQMRLLIEDGWHHKTKKYKVQLPGATPLYDAIFHDATRPPESSTRPPESSTRPSAPPAPPIAPPAPPALPASSSGVVEGDALPILTDEEILPIIERMLQYKNKDELEFRAYGHDLSLEEREIDYIWNRPYVSARNILAIWKNGIPAGKSRAVVHI